MIRFAQSLKAWGTPGFEGVLKQEIEQLEAGQLPLQQGLSGTSHVADTEHKAMIVAVEDEAGFIRVKAGIFYGGILVGCSCADDPTPVEEQNEYCEVLLEIDKKTAETAITLLDEK